MRSQTMSRKTASYCLDQFKAAVKRHERKQRRDRWRGRIDSFKSTLLGRIWTSIGNLP